MNDPKRLPVLHGIDLLRTLSFFCITTYHSYATFIFVPYNPADWAGTPMPLIDALPRAFPFSGFTIVAIYAFLSGLRNRPLPLKRPLIAVIPGLLLLMLIYSDFDRWEIFWEWDIYHYLLVSLLSLLLLSRTKALAYAFGALGGVLLLFPLWNWIPASSLPLPLAHALVGICDSDGRGGWFLLPWIGFPWLFFALGRFWNRLPSVSYRELFFWAPPLLLGTLTWGSYFGVDIGPGFYCFMFRQPPYVFWGHFLWITFVLRLSATPGAQAFLERFAFLRWLSGLRINRHFGLAYLLQLFWLWLGSLFLLPALGARGCFYLFVPLLIPFTELSMRALTKAFSLAPRLR